MVHHIGLYKLKPGVTPEETEEMMMNARMQLLKIDEVFDSKISRQPTAGGDRARLFALAHIDQRFRVSLKCNGTARLVSGPRRVN